MRCDWDVVVVGLGGFGSAAAYWLSARPGLRVLGLEQFDFDHDNGASKDHSRIASNGVRSTTSLLVFPRAASQDRLSSVVWNGWEKRRDVQSHKRLMLSAAIMVMMGPAVGRLPIAPPTVVGITILFLLGLALFTPLFLWDRRTIGHIHPATRFGFSLAALSVAIPLAVFWFNLPWASVAAHLPGINA